MAQLISKSISNNIKMDKSNDIQALENISSEVDESQIKVIFSSQCVSAQNFLLGKLRKEAERKKELYHHISRANFKLEMEIKHAELEIKSMRLAHDTIKSANVELKKELLLAKEKNVQIRERIEIGVKKYEALWMESKARFETIPFVRKYLQITERVKTLKTDVEDIGKQAEKINEDIYNRKTICESLDKQRVIELADFMINELPIKTKLIKEKTERINILTKQMNDLLKAQVCVQEITEIAKPAPIALVSNNLPCQTFASIKKDDDFLLPKLELTDFDIDLNDVNLDMVIKKNLEICKNTPVTADPVITCLDPSLNDRKDERADDFIISPYIYKPIHEEKAECFSEKKLINILEDVKIDEKEAFNIVSKSNPEKFEVVHEISAVGSNNKATPLETEDIEVIDLTSTNTENILIPPSQFLDIIVQVSQESLPKKRVSFDLRTAMQINEINDVENNEPKEEVNEQNQSMTSQLDISFGCDESFMRIKDLILKRHNLDFSPQFVYARPNVLQKNDDDRLVKSKFFEQEDKCTVIEDAGNNISKMDVQPEVKEDEEIINIPDENNTEPQNNNDKEIPMDYDEQIVSSQKTNNENEEQQTQKPISGLLFTHGSQGIPDSLNVSISTAGYEDSDFPHCIDPSLLLSPKADLPMSVDNAEVVSQDVPNFLSGLRKTGLSFFGGGPSTSSKPDQTNPQNEGNSFNFNFGGEEKKKRGGLFSMFH